MTEKTVDVYLLAQPRAGVEPEVVVRNLAGLFKKDVPTIEKLLAKPRTLVKAGVDVATAEKYRRAIQQAGCDCELVERAAAVPVVAQSSSPAPSLAAAGAGVEVSPERPENGKETGAENGEENGVRSASADADAPALPLWRLVIEQGRSLRLLLPLVILVVITLAVFAFRGGNPVKQSATGASPVTKTEQSDTKVGAQPESASKPAESLRTFSDDKRISLTTPSDWKGERRLNPEAAIGVANSRENLYAVVLRENKPAFGSDFSLQRYSELIAQGLQKSTQDFYLQEAPRKLDINGVEALQTALAAKVDGINIIYVITTLETPEHFYVIYAWTLASRFETHHQLLKQVSETFTLH